MKKIHFGISPAQHYELKQFLSSQLQRYPRHQQTQQPEVGITDDTGLKRWTYHFRSSTRRGKKNHILFG